MEFKNKTAVITGGAKGIGKTIADEFVKNGANVCIIDILPDRENDNKSYYFQGDVADEKVLKTFADEVIAKYGTIDYLINNALPPTKGIDTCSFDEFNYALQVGITAPFYLAKLLSPHFAPCASIINISSTRSIMSQPQTESYAAAKGGISALTHALAVSLGEKARVNSISPGWINTTSTKYDGVDALQHPVGRVGNPLDIAHMALFLCSEKSGFITGQDIVIDGGMTCQMIYTGDNGWALSR